MSINDTKVNGENLKNAVDNLKFKNKQPEADLISQLSTAPNSPVAFGPDMKDENKDQEDQEPSEEQELSEEQVGP